MTTMKTKKTQIVFSEFHKKNYSVAFKDGFKTGQRQAFEVVLAFLEDGSLREKLEKELERE